MNRMSNLVFDRKDSMEEIQVIVCIFSNCSTSARRRMRLLPCSWFATRWQFYHLHPFPFLPPPHSAPTPIPPQSPFCCRVCHAPVFDINTVPVVCSCLRVEIFSKLRRMRRMRCELKRASWFRRTTRWGIDAQISMCSVSVDNINQYCPYSSNLSAHESLVLVFSLLYWRWLAFTLTCVAQLLIHFYDQQIGSNISKTETLLNALPH